MIIKDSSLILLSLLLCIPNYHIIFKRMIADVLQDAGPIEEWPKKNKRDEIIKGVQEPYTMSAKQTTI